MKKAIFRICLVFVIVIIFIGMGIAPTAAIFQEDIIEINNDVKVTNIQNNNCNNSLGEMKVVWDIDRWGLVPWSFIDPVLLRTNYYFSEQNGNLIANFSVNCTTYLSNPYIPGPRSSFFMVVIHNGPTKRSRVLESGYKLKWIRDVGTDTPPFCMELENVSIPLNGGESRELFVELICGGHPFNPGIFGIPFFIRKDATLIVVTKKWIEGQPYKPTITGPITGKPGIEYEYTFNAVDPDGDNVKYHIDWGDTKSNTTDFSPSGTDVKIKHNWSTEGTYTIKATAEDTNGLVGPEGALSVSMPIIKTYTDRPILGLLQNFLENHPLVYHLLQRVLRL